MDEETSFFKRRWHSGLKLSSSQQCSMVRSLRALRGELHGLKLVKISFALSWNQDVLVSVK